MPEDTDELVSGTTVTVTLTLTGPGLDAVFSGDNGTGKKNHGIFRTGWVPDLSDGTYAAEVTSLAHDSFAWNQALDPTGNDTDLDGDNQPDQQHFIPH